MSNKRIQLTDCGNRWRRRCKKLGGDHYFPKSEYPTKKLAWYAWLSKQEQLEQELEEQVKPNPVEVDYPGLYRQLFSESDTREMAKERLSWCVAHGEEIEAQQYRDYLENPSLMETLDLFWWAAPQSKENVWKDRLERQNRFKQTPQQSTVGYQLDEFCGLKKTNVAESTYGAIVERLEVFKKRIGEKTHCDSINEIYVKSFRDWALERFGNETNRYAHDLFCAFKEFVRYLSNNKIIERPENLDDKLLVIRVHKLEPIPFTVKEIKTALENSTDRTKLFTLLALNVSAAQIDISSLKQVNIDWEKGELTKKRVKTKREKRVPKVRYKLWESTFDLLKEFNSGKSPVLTSEKGEALLKRKFNKKTNKSHRECRISKSWSYLAKENGLSTEFSRLRDTSAHFLQNSLDISKGEVDYSHYRDAFLGHSPKGSGDQSYGPLVKIPDVVTDWLEEQLGISKIE